MSSAKDRFYGSRLWKRMRLAVMERDGWRCRHCGDYLRRLVVHHVKPAIQFGEVTADAWRMANCVTLCWRCHEKEHRGRGGRRLPRRSRNPKRNAWAEAVRERMASIN